MVELLVVSEEDAARKLGVSTRTLQRWRVEGRGPRFTKLGKLVGYTEASLVKYVEDNQRQSTSDRGQAA
jgi:predicted site-specific integrase-resolvase